MIIPNGNYSYRQTQTQLNVNSASLQRQIVGSYHSLASPSAPSALNAPFLARIHNVRPGCGSCGRH
jgi:hypothetical protein